MKIKSENLSTSILALIPREFTIEFYETSSGGCPVRDFLDELKDSNPDDFAAVLAGLAKLRNREYHRPPLHCVSDRLPCKENGIGFQGMKHEKTNKF